MPNFVFLTGDLGFQALEPLARRRAAAIHQRGRGRAEHGVGGGRIGLDRTEALGLQHRPVRLCPALRADSQRRLHARPAGYAGGQRRRLRLRRDGRDAPRLGRLRGVAVLAKHARLRAGLRRRRADAGRSPGAISTSRLSAAGTVRVAGRRGSAALCPLATVGRRRRPDAWSWSGRWWGAFGGPSVGCPSSVARRCGRSRNCRSAERRFTPEFLDGLRRSRHLVVVEEHVAHGGAGEMLLHVLAQWGKRRRASAIAAAEGYVTGYFGSQTFHRKECGLDPESIIAELLS